jgi:sialate O-acetylesterase
MVGAVGGTPSGYWLSAEQLAADEPCQALIKKYAATFNMDEAQKKYEAELAKWEQDDAKAKQDKTRPPRKPNPPVKPGEATGNKVGCLYAAHVQPFIPYAIRGVVWDQGESGTALNGVDQYTLMGGLIRGWRKEWNQGEFPFIYIQKPSGGGCAWDNANPVTNKGEKFEPLPAKVPADGQYVETHIKIMNYRNTAMAISSDLGPGVHPTNKSGYGHRAADVALGLVYGKKVEYYGPVFDSVKIDGNKARVSFKHVGRGLAFKNGDKLQGFAVAGVDKNFHWADATIDGDAVVLTCTEVSQPAFVRYAWANNRRWANLFNKDGLPAIPFRTDQ